MPNISLSFFFDPEDICPTYGGCGFEDPVCEMRGVLNPSNRGCVRHPVSIIFIRSNGIVRPQGTLSIQMPKRSGILAHLHSRPLHTFKYWQTSHPNAAFQKIT